MVSPLSRLSTVAPEDENVIVVVALAVKLLLIKSLLKSMVVGSVFTYSLVELDEELELVVADEELDDEEEEE